MTNAEILEGLGAIQKIAAVIPPPLGPIVATAIIIAQEAIEQGTGDPLQKLEELRRILAAGITADWQSKLNG
jgi:hypothetical protein